MAVARLPALADHWPPSAGDRVEAQTTESCSALKGSDQQGHEKLQANCWAGSGTGPGSHTATLQETDHAGSRKTHAHGPGAGSTGQHRAWGQGALQHDVTVPMSPHVRQTHRRPHRRKPSWGQLVQQAHGLQQGTALGTSLAGETFSSAVLGTCDHSLT